MYKARLVSKGYYQQYDIDYLDTFSPVDKMVNVRTILALAASYNWDIQQMDVVTVFLQGNLLEEVYMDIPEEFGNPKGDLVCRLHKSLYGLKQSSLKWNIKSIESLIKSGYIQSKYVWSLFTKKDNTNIVIMLVYVDDLLITCSSSNMITELKQVLKGSFMMKDLGSLQYFLGIEVAKSEHGLVLNQCKYALDLISDLGRTRSKPVSTLMEFNTKFSIVEYDRLFNTN